MRLVRLFVVLALSIVWCGFSSAQSSSSVYTWSAPGILGGNFTSTAADCSSVEAALVDALNTQIGVYAPWSVKESPAGSCTNPQSSAVNVIAHDMNGDYGGSINFVSGPSVPVTPVSPPASALAGGSGNQYVVECVPNGASTSVAPCNNVSTNGYSPVMFQAYVVDSSFSQGLSPDPSIIAAFWAFGITTVVSLYLVSKYVGSIVGFVRSVIR